MKEKEFVKLLDEKNKKPLKLNPKNSEKETLVVYHKEFNEKDFSWFDITHAIFYGCLFNNCKFYQTRLKSCSFHSCTFLKCKMDGSDFSRSDFDSCTFEENLFEHFKCFSSCFNSSTFSVNGMINSSFDHALFRFCTFADNNMESSSFDNTLNIDSLLRANRIDGCNLSSADFYNSRLDNNVILTNNEDYFTRHFNNACPKEGAFYGFKVTDDAVVTLLIPEDALRCSSTTDKCRCSKAVVVKIENLSTREEMESTASKFDPLFIYKKGELVKVDNFDPDWQNECSAGIHFFMTKEQAIKYGAIY